MKHALQGFSLDIDISPQLTHPLVGAFIDPDLELSEAHIQCIYDAVRVAQEMVMKGESK
jgi:hypothetical protein